VAAIVEIDLMILGEVIERRERLAERETRVLRRGLDEQLLERRAAEDLAVRDRVERDAAGEAEVGRADELVRELAVIVDAAFEHRLRGVRDVCARLERVAACGEVVAQQLLV